MCSFSFFIMTQQEYSTFVLQQGPEAQVALTASLQVVATQHGLSQNSLGPQSHCSSASTTPSPQLVIGYIRIGTLLRHL